MDHRRVYETLLDLESRVDVNAWRVAGIPVWPLVRTDLWMKLLAAPDFCYAPAEAVAPLPPEHRTMADPWPDFVAAARDALSLPCGLARADILAWSRHEDHTEMFAGGCIDRMIDPLLGDAAELGWTGVKLSRADVAANTRRDFLHRGFAVALDGAHAAVADIPLVDTTPPLFAYLRAALPGVVFEQGYLRSRVRRLLGRAAVFTRLFEAVRPRLVVMAVFYSQDAAALCHACYRAGITSVDIQHGKQGLYHAMYGGWSRLPRQGYSVLPDYCWVWGSESARLIDTAKPHRSRSLEPVIGGNRWLTRWLAGKHPQLTATAQAFLAAEPEARRFVLSLQPLAELVPHFVLDAMRASPPGWRWWIRLHPHSRGRAGELDAQLRAAGIVNYDIDNASAAPLYALLERADAHLTCWSTVAYEAVAFGVPSVIVHDTGRRLYAEDLEAGLFRTARTSDTLLELLTGARPSQAPAALAGYLTNEPGAAAACLQRFLSRRARLRRWSKRIMRHNIVLLAVATLVAAMLFVALGEAYARYFFATTAPVSWRDEAIRLRVAGQGVLPWVNPLRQNGPPDWTGTIPDELIVSGGETGTYMRWRSGSNGVKNPPEHWETHAAFDVISVGDSSDPPEALHINVANSGRFGDFNARGAAVAPAILASRIVTASTPSVEAVGR